MAELGWTNAQIVNLIQEYKSRPMLWDPNNDYFRVQSSKYEAWAELADLFDCEIVDLKKKFNSIFASHRREKSKVKLGGRSTWFLYNHLSFLPSHVSHEECAVPSTPSVNMIKWISRKKPKPIEEVEIENEPDVEDESDHEEAQEDDGSSVHIIIKEEPQIEEPPPKYYTPPKPKLLRSRLIRKRQPERNLVYERKMCKRPEVFKRHEYKKKDECDSFGEYIAISLRKHDERTRSMIKQAINNILFEQEMKKYNSSGQYVVISSVDENPLIIGDECEK